MRRFATLGKKLNDLPALSRQHTHYAVAIAVVVAGVAALSDPRDPVWLLVT